MVMRRYTRETKSKKRPISRPSGRITKKGRRSAQLYRQPPELQLIYDTAPVGLAFLTPDCRYAQINLRLTEICGISVADHIGRSVRETVPQVADQVEKIVQTILQNGTPIIGVEVNGQRTDEFNGDRFWSTSWHPLKGPDGSILGINVVAEEITERKRAEAALVASEAHPDRVLPRQRATMTTYNRETTLFMISSQSLFRTRCGPLVVLKPTLVRR